MSHCIGGCDFLCDYQLDRFIPNRSAMDFDYAHYMLTEGRKDKENPAVNSSPAREAYRKQLAEAFNMNRSRILAFKNKPPTPVELIPREFSSSMPHEKPTKPKRSIPQVHICVGLSLNLKVAFDHRGDTRSNFLRFCFGSKGLEILGPA